MNPLRNGLIKIDWTATQPIDVLDLHFVPIFPADVKSTTTHSSPSIENVMLLSAGTCIKFNLWKLQPKEKVKHQINETVFVQCQYMTAISNESHTRRQIVFTFWFRCMIKCTHLDAVNPKLTSTNVHTTTLLMTSLFWVTMILLDNFKFISKHTRNHCKCSFWMHFWNEMSDTFFEKYYFWTHYLFTIMSELYCYVAFSCSTIQKCGKTSLLLVWLLVHFIIVITCLKNTWPILKIVIFLWIS